MLNRLAKIEGVEVLDKNAQKNITGGWGPGEYIDNCGPADDGLPCLTGTPHCPIGTCLTSVCVPNTGH